MDTVKKQSLKPTGRTSFIRYNIAAVAATGADFTTLIFFKETLGVWYVTSTALGALVGAIVAFTLGRNWAFVSKEAKKTTQAAKYILVAAGSLSLNTLGVYLLTDLMEYPYLISKVITALIVALFYNYTLSKYYIFK